MKKLEQLKPYENGLDALFKELYEKFDSSKFRTRNDLPTYRGVYAFYEKGEAIYVGRSNNIRKRIQWHTRESSGSESASFAFNLAKRDYPKSEVAKTRRELMMIEAFFEIFRAHKINLHNLEFRCIEIENDILQTMFEPYLAFKLKTYPTNNIFENH